MWCHLLKFTIYLDVSIYCHCEHVAISMLLLLLTIGMKKTAVPKYSFTEL